MMLQSWSLECLAKCIVVGKGITADVYALDHQRVLKLFHNKTAHIRAEHEFKVTRAVQSAGLPAPAVHALVELGGRPGIVFERVDGPSIFKQVQRRPWRLFAAVRQLAQLHAQIHACVAPPELPSQREWIAGRIHSADELSAAEKDRLRQCVEALPDGTSLCHGDFHPDNVLVTARGPVIIDWSSATRGNPLGDVAVTSHLIQTADLPPWAPLHAHLMLKISRTFLHRTYLNAYLRLRPANRQEIEAWQVPISATVKSRHDELRRSARRKSTHSERPDA
jgi:uncharacterized protein (TIGR02172 family)